MVCLHLMEPYCVEKLIDVKCSSVSQVNWRAQSNLILVLGALTKLGLNTVAKFLTPILLRGSSATLWRWVRMKKRERKGTGCILANACLVIIVQFINPVEVLSSIPHLVLFNNLKLLRKEKCGTLTHDFLITWTWKGKGIDQSRRQDPCLVATW